jgi:GH24 family phage-related lysozyme (muramidase)
MDKITISTKGVDLVKHEEVCRLKAYTDIVGLWMIGYGRL